MKVVGAAGALLHAKKLSFSRLIAVISPKLHRYHKRRHANDEDSSEEYASSGRCAARQWTRALAGVPDQPSPSFPDDVLVSDRSLTVILPACVLFLSIELWYKMLAAGIILI